MDCRLYLADYQNILSLYDHYPSLERFARMVAENHFVQKEKKELELAMLNAAQRYTLFQQEFPELEALVPQYQVASYLGVSPTQLSRIRSQRTA